MIRPSVRDADWVGPATILVGLQYAAAIAVSYTVGFEQWPPVLSYLIVAFVLSAASGLVLFLLRLRRLWQVGENHPISRLRREADYGAIATYFLGFQIIALQIGALTWLKEMLPLAVPFWADPALAALDHEVLGRDAWRLVPVALIPSLDVIYANWAPVKTLVLLVTLSLPAAQSKSHAMISFFLTLGVLGVVGQYAFSSAGPIFYGRLGLGDEFAPLLEVLHAKAPIATAASEYLWSAYRESRAGFGAGISAMPSIHVALTTWAALTVTAAWPRLRIPVWLFWAATFVGSFALGWHYLSDSIVGAFGAWLCWIAAARFTRPRVQVPQGAVELVA